MSRKEPTRAPLPSARELLARHGLSPIKSLGQNFLVDPRVPARIVGAAELSPEDVVVEIGAGLGALTTQLVGRARRIIAIERDARLALVLREELGSRDDVVVVEGDALEFDWLAAAGAAGRPVVVVGNLPYVVTSPVLFATLAAADGGRIIRRALFMVQKELAQRMLAPPGSRTYGRLSVMTQQRAEAHAVFDVGAGAFWPVPAVTSTVVCLRPRAQPLGPVRDPALFDQLVREAFGTRRKMLRRALEPAFGNARASAALAAAGIAGTRRAEELSVAEFARLANALADARAS